MENSFQTSFIPKKPITSNISDSVKEPTNFFALISIFLLIVSVLISIGLFVYKVYLLKQEETLSSSLLITRDSFEKNTIDELELFDKRTQSAKNILANHIAMSPLFPILEDVTIPQVQYISFDEQIDDKGVILVNLRGIAQDYKSIVLQSDVFNSPKGASFKNVLFSNLLKDKNNNVSFSLKFNIDPNLLSYEKNILLEQANNSVSTVSAPIDTTTPTPTPTTDTQLPSTTVNNNTTVTQTGTLPGGLNNQSQ